MSDQTLPHDVDYALCRLRKRLLAFGWHDLLEYVTLCRQTVARLTAENAELRDRAEKAEAELARTQRERDAYRKAKQENDERFMNERDEARNERDAALREVADLRDRLDDLLGRKEASDGTR